MICLLQCNNPQESEIHTGRKFLKNGLSACYFILNHILICIWTLEWTSGTCFVGVRISIQLSTSSADRILQTTLIFKDISLVFRYESIRPHYTHGLCPFNVAKQDFVL